MPDISPHLISMNQVCSLTSLSRTRINEYRRDGQFPEPIPLGVKRIAFIRAEVEQWIDDRIAAARGRAA